LVEEDEQVVEDEDEQVVEEEAKPMHVPEKKSKMHVKRKGPIHVLLLMMDMASSHLMMKRNALVFCRSMMMMGLNHSQ
jgi:hypothetical protein